MEQEISQKIIEKIKKEHITPQSRFKLNWKSYTYWTILTVMILFGAIFLSLITLSYLDIDRDLMRELHLGILFRLILALAPIFWISLLALSLISGVIAFRSTRHGYRYRTIFIAAIVILLVSVLGATAHFSKINERMEKNLSANFPGFPSPGLREPRHFADPENGMLHGKIIEYSENLLMIKTQQGEEWTIKITSETKISRMAKLEKDSLVMVVGEQTAEREFLAKFIKEPRPRGPFGRQGTMRFPAPPKHF